VGWFQAIFRASRLTMQQFWSALSSDYVVVVAIYLLYAFDSVSRRRRGELSVTFSSSPRFFFSDSPFVLGNRVVTFERLFRPWRLIKNEDFLSSTPWLDPKPSQRRYVRVLRRIILPISVLSSYNALLLLVALPALVPYVGLSTALITCGPLVYANSVLILLQIYLSPVRRRLSKRDWLGLISDFLLCPPYTPNAPQRVFSHFHVPFRLTDFLLNAERREGGSPLREMLSFAEFEREEYGLGVTAFESAVSNFIRNQHEA
jgi:hypothetical protein